MPQRPVDRRKQVNGPKAHERGGNVQALSGPDGFPLWVADAEPGFTHDLTVAREHVLGAVYWAASHLGLPTLADGGYDGAGIGVHTPYIQPAGDQILHADNRTYNALPRGLRCLGERGFAVLTGRWRTLHHITASPARSATSSKPHSSSPTSNTADTAKSVRSLHCSRSDHSPMLSQPNPTQPKRDALADLLCTVTACQFAGTHRGNPPRPAHRYVIATRGLYKTPTTILLDQTGNNPR
jgi:hypothetical protein